MVLPATDRYAVLLVAFFAKLDGYAELMRPHKPPAPDQQVSNERLQNSRNAAYEKAVERWKIDYLQPWEQRKERHEKQKRAERRKTLRNRTSEAAAVGDATAMQRQDSEHDRKRQRRDEQRSVQCDGASFTSQFCVTNHPFLIHFSFASHPLLIGISSASHPHLIRF